MIIFPERGETAMAAVSTPYWTFEPFEPRILLSADVLTYHNDLQSTGQNLNETILTPANVNPQQFGKLFSYAVDGYVYAQPLIKRNVPIAGKGVHDVVFVATEHDSVYAFDANSNQYANAQPLWHVSFIDPANGIRPLKTDEVGTVDIMPEVGITGTPVIDPATNTLYVVARTREPGPNGSSLFIQRLHALDIRSGAEKFGGPVVINPTMPGTGSGNDGHGKLTFNSLRQNQRAALSLVNGVVYITWAGHADIPPFHGWIVGYDAATLKQVTVFNTTPNGDDGGIWMSGGRISSDKSGNLYVVTGNGAFDANTGGANYGESILRLSTSGSLHPVDYFTPYNYPALNSSDLDLGSGGLLILPDQPGPHPHIGIFGGKEAKFYVVDLDNLGKFNSDHDAVLQVIENQTHGQFGTAAYFNGVIYYLGTGYAGQKDSLTAFPINNGHVATTPSSKAAEAFPFPGATPSVSANGAKDGIVWVLQNGIPSVLRAYDAANVSKQLYASSTNSGDAAGPGVKFAVPTVANGHVYVGVKSGLVVYGLKNGVAIGAPELEKLDTSKTGRIMLSWNALASATGYQVERSVSGGAFTTIANLGSGVTTFTDSDVHSPVVYSYRVRATTSAGAGEASNARSGSPASPQVIRAPSRLVADTTFSDRVQIRWNDQSSNETGFVLERSADGRNFAVLASLKKNATAFTDKNVLDATRYTYRVRAVLKQNSSAFSNKDSATTRPMDGEIGYWNFEEGSGSAVGDVSGHSHRGPIVGEVTHSDGKVGAGALSFHGVGSAISHVQIRDQKALRFTAAASFTLSVWARPTAVPSNLQAIVSKSREKGAFYGLFVNPAGQFEFDGSGASIQGGTVSAGWHYVVGVQDGRRHTRMLYVDGKPVGKGPSANASGTGDLWIGGANSQMQSFAGSIDDVRLFSRALTAAQVLRLSRLARPNAPANLGATSIGTTQIALAWDDTSSNEASFEIQQSLDGTTFQTIGATRAGDTEFVAEGLASGTLYFFRVRAVNLLGTSDFTDVLNIRTAA
jgi:hypothetical protein